MILPLVLAVLIGVPTFWIIKAVLNLSWGDILRMILALRVRRS